MAETQDSEREAPAASQPVLPPHKAVLEIHGEPFWTTSWAVEVIALAFGALLLGIVLERARDKA